MRTVNVNMTTLKSFGDASLFLMALIASLGLKYKTFHSYEFEQPRNVIVKCRVPVEIAFMKWQFLCRYNYLQIEENVSHDQRHFCLIH